MRFAEYRSGWNKFSKGILGGQFKNEGEIASYMLDNELLSDPISFRHGLFVEGWWKTKRPYYDVYPSIIDALIKLNLDFPGELVQRPSGLDHLYLKLPEGGHHSLKEDGISVQGIFLSFQRVTRGQGSDEIVTGLVVGIDIGEVEQNMDAMPVFTLRIFPLDERNISKTMTSLPAHETAFEGDQMSDDLIARCVKLVIAVCMLQEDSSILEPQILRADFGKSADLRLLVDKAKRRGKFGFSLGRHIEVAPHIRRPHPALVWTGKGRKIPRIVFRKGSVVHRKVIESIPTGRKDS